METVSYIDYIAARLDLAQPLRQGYISLPLRTIIVQRCCVSEMVRFEPSLLVYTRPEGIPYGYMT